MSRRGILFVGQAPSRGTVGKPALGGKSGEHLARLFGYRRVSDFADAVNVFEHWPGKSGRKKGCLFPMGEARERAPLIKELFPRYRAVVLLGRCVVEAMGYDPNSSPCTCLLERSSNGDPMTFDRVTATYVYTLPHPSGVNHWYNSLENRIEARELANLILRRGLGSTR